MIKIFRLIVVVGLLVSTAAAEMRMWTADDGTRFWGEFQRMLLGRIQVLDVNDELRLLTIDKLSEEDLSYMEATVPPEVDISVKKNSRHLRNLINDVDHDVRQAYSFEVTVTKKSKLNCTSRLTLELYVIAEDITHWCDDWVLMDRKTSSFVFPQERESQYVFESDEVIFRTVDCRWFDDAGLSTMRGQEYEGYVAVVLGSKGEMLGYDTNIRKSWMADLGDEEVAKRLRTLYIENRGGFYSRFFNESIKKVPPPSVPNYFRGKNPGDG